MNAQIAAQTARTPGWMYETCPLGGYQVKDGNGYVIAQFDREVLANQAVTRNNAHDDLVAALGKMIRIARHESDPRTIREACREAEILLTNVATAALAKAGAL